MASSDFVLSNQSIALALCVIGVGDDLSCCDDGIFTSQRPSELFHCSLRIGLFLALKIVTPFFCE